MEVDYDIYSDLSTEDIDLSSEVQRLQEQVKQLEQHIQSLEADIEKLGEDLTNIKKVRENLERNISELYKTAKTEIDRKDKIIHDQRKIIDEYVCQKKFSTISDKHGRQNSPKSYRENVKQARKIYPEDRSKSSSNKRKRSRSRSADRHKSTFRDKSKDRNKTNHHTTETRQILKEERVQNKKISISDRKLNKEECKVSTQNTQQKENEIKPKSQHVKIEKEKSEDIRFSHETKKNGPNNNSEKQENIKAEKETNIVNPSSLNESNKNEQRDKLLKMKKILCSKENNEQINNLEKAENNLVTMVEKNIAEKRNPDECKKNEENSKLEKEVNTLDAMMENEKNLLDQIDANESKKNGQDKLEMNEYNLVSEEKNIADKCKKNAQIDNVETGENILKTKMDEDKKRTAKTSLEESKKKEQNTKLEREVCSDKKVEKPKHISQQNPNENNKNVLKDKLEDGEHSLNSNEKNVAERRNPEERKNELNDKLEIIVVNTLNTKVEVEKPIVPKKSSLETKNEKTKGKNTAERKNSEESKKNERSDKLEIVVDTLNTKVEKEKNIAVKKSSLETKNQKTREKKSKQNKPKIEEVTNKLKKKLGDSEKESAAILSDKCETYANDQQITKVSSTEDVTGKEKPRQEEISLIPQTPHLCTNDKKIVIPENGAKPANKKHDVKVSSGSSEPSTLKTCKKKDTKNVSPGLSKKNVHKEKLTVETKKDKYEEEVPESDRVLRSARKRTGYGEFEDPISTENMTEKHVDSNILYNNFIDNIGLTLDGEIPVLHISDSDHSTQPDWNMTRQICLPLPASTSSPRHGDVDMQLLKDDLNISQDPTNVDEKLNKSVVTNNSCNSSVTNLSLKNDSISNISSVVSPLRKRRRVVITLID